MHLPIAARIQTTSPNPLNIMEATDKLRLVWFAPLESNHFQAIIERSSACFQEISHTCSSMMLTGFSSWIGRTGMVNNYWHGNGSTTQTGCKCGLDKSCAKILHHTSCNCDSYLENMKDNGVLTSMDQLPVKKLNYGGAFSSFGSIQFDLGPLICSGK